MAEGGVPIPVDALGASGWSETARRLLEVVADVGRRLDHDVLGVEHLLVAGAEAGDPAMARVAASLAAFREALLDRLHQDRARFRRRRAGRSPGMSVQPPLAAAFARLNQGAELGPLLAELMQSRSPRIARALALARGAGPDVVPPDTQTLELERSPASVSIEAPAGATPGAPPQAEAGGRPEGRVVPLTIDLCRDTLDDLPLIGRAAALEQAARTLLRFHGPVLLLVGDPGSGKTAFARGLARAACSGELPGLAQFRFHELRVLDLVSQRHHGQDVPALLSGLLEHMTAMPNSVLVIDDLHTLLVRPGLPETAELLDTLKLHLKRGKLRALLTVARGDYEKLLAADAYFANEITLKRLPPLDQRELVAVLAQFRPRLEKHFGVTIADEALEAAVSTSLGEPDPDSVPPGSSIRLLDEACALARPPGEARVTAAHVARAASEAAPADAEGPWDRTRLAHLAEELNKSVQGQELAAEAVARRVRLSKLHLDRKPHRPDGVFLFIGPSGVGKTEMARALARALYGNEAHLVRLDMSEYLEPHSVARIIGAPPGYVGYGEEGALTGPIARLGHGVVLLDEIEKAHPQVLNLFLQVFDDGRLTDSKGREVDFSDSVIIMTSNMGRELYDQQQQRAIGFGKLGALPASGPPRDAVHEHLLRVLPAEFVNRIDEVVPFRILDEQDIAGIGRRLLDMEVVRWRARGKLLRYDAEVERVLATSGYDPRLGARHLERNLERLVIALLSDAAVRPEFDAVKEMRLFVQKGAICLALDGRPFECLTPPAAATGSTASSSPAAPGERAEGARAAARRPPTPPPGPLPPPKPPRGGRPSGGPRRRRRP